MRPLLLSLALLFVACSETQSRLPPSDRFAYPSGIAYRPGSASGNTHGVLYVSSANFDRCFDRGTVMAVDLDALGPSTDGQTFKPLGGYTDPSASPATFEQLNIAPGSRVYIQSYAGEMVLREGTADSLPRLIVPARADRDLVHYIDIKEPARLACTGTESSDDCLANGAVSLTDGLSGQSADLPRAPAPFGVSIDPDDGNVWVTHLNPADSPARSLENYASYVVRLPGDTPRVSASEDFFPLNIPDLPEGGGNSVVADTRYVFVSGRFSPGVTDSLAARRFLVRVLEKPDPETGSTGRIIDPGLDLGFAAEDARGMALTAAETGARRLYVAVRSPDSLVTVNVQGLEPGGSLSLNVVGSVPLPNGPTEVALVRRDGPSTGRARSELVLVSCSTAGVLAIYDPDVGQVVAQVPVGQATATQSSQPFGIAVQQQDNAARVFVSNFGDGRISVVDIPDLDSPQLARLVAYLGARQDLDSTCQEVQQ